jgi:glycosyltransferase involved in cell wall biosynthesis
LKSSINDISVIVLTKNEALGIGDCLARISMFSDVTVVDSDSSDPTASIVEASGIKVVNFNWNHQYPKKKQWALDSVDTHNDWVLLLDADEYPSEKLVRELEIFSKTKDLKRYGAFDVNLTYKFAGRFLRFGHTVTKRSLINKRFCQYPVVDDLDAPGISEVEGHYQPQTDLKIGKLNSRLMHDDKDPLSSWFSRHNRYSDWEAYLAANKSLKKAIASKRTSKGELFDKFPFKSAAFFLYSYFARLGFLDGSQGFAYAWSLSFYYWQIELKKRELTSKTAQKKS